jgi:hypothetical protein
LGRYLVSKLGKFQAVISFKPHMLNHCLGKMGTQVVVPYREEDEARIFKPMGDLGQIVRMVSSSMSLSKSIFLFKVGKKEWDLRNENSIAECLRHSDIVFNLTGRDFATKYARFSHLLSPLDRSCHFHVGTSTLDRSMLLEQKR